MENLSTRCLVIAPNGEKCTNWAVEDAPVNLCIEHLRTAHKFAQAHPEFLHDRTIVDRKCPTCGSSGMYYYEPFFPTIHCDNCGSTWKRNLNRVSNLEYSSPATRRRTNKTIAPSQPVVYYIEHGGQVKIGTSINWINRVASLPHDLLLALEPGGYETEQKRHSQFSRSRVRRTEWFDVSEELMSHIDRVRTEHPELTREAEVHNRRRAS